MWSYLLLTVPKRYKRNCLDFKRCRNLRRSVIIKLRTNTWFVAFFGRLCNVFYQIPLNDLILLTFIYCYHEGIYRPIKPSWDVFSLFLDYINLASPVSSFKSWDHVSAAFSVLCYETMIYLSWYEMAPRTDSFYHHCLSPFPTLLYFMLSDMSNEGGCTIVNGKLSWLDLKYGTDNAKIARMTPIQDSCTFLHCRGLDEMVFRTLPTLQFYIFVLKSNTYNSSTPDN